MYNYVGLKINTRCRKMQYSGRQRTKQAGRFCNSAKISYLCPAFGVIAVKEE